MCPRKCGLFGVTCEGMPQQVTYLIDEAMTISKGANSVINYLDHFLANYGLGETTLQLHCDNCSGQNKNNYLMWYLAWTTIRTTIHQLHSTVSVNVLITGRTKFGPDRCFGLIKQRYCREIVSCLNDLVDVVNNTTITGVNIAQKVGSEDCEVIVPQADWQAFLRPFFRVMPGIKRYHNFHFDSTQPGMLFCTEYAHSEEESFRLLQDQHRLPQPMTPPCLDVARQNYLHDKIREFCTPHTRDITCPPPAAASRAAASRAASVGSSGPTSWAQWAERRGRGAGRRGGQARPRAGKPPAEQQ